MLFYGDVDRLEFPSSIRRSIAQTLRQVVAAPAGHERHWLLTKAFIEAGELVQGLADRDLERLGADMFSDAQAAGSDLLLLLAHALRTSWENAFAGALVIPDGWADLLQKLECPEKVRLKRAEGYAFYCLYPENYLEAARRAGLPASTVVIGLRSIGTGLSALVAAALGSGQVFSLRPVGRPFERRLAISPALASQILENPFADFAIVDEGPGLSGSSFGCVADWLGEQGVVPDRIHFFPSHGGDLGAQASLSHRTRWSALPRHVVTADETILSPDRSNTLLDWVRRLTGEKTRMWQEISGGAWRVHRYSGPEAWPPVHAAMEKRKFLLRGDHRTWLVKFAGLDGLALRRLSTAAVLAEAGHAPPRQGTSYGFAVEAWLRASPVDEAQSNDDVVDALAGYLGFRARHLPPTHGGASLSELCAMAVLNTGEALGVAAGDTLRKRISHASRIANRLKRVDTDNRLHRWEWLALPDGRILKTDAVDHNAAHDFVGCQDIAWDIAGATVEFGLSDAQRDRLAESIAASADAEPDRKTLEVLEYCYIAFQIGLWTYARAAASAEECPRIELLLRRYRDRLAMLLRR